MTDPMLMYVRVRCSAGHWHRRYPRWSEVDPSARLPEQQWRWRWRLDDRCAVAIPSLLASQVGRFQPCRGRPVSGMDLCRQHAQLERRVGAQGGGLVCHAPLLGWGATVDAVGGSE